ncbi:hypothetical protein P0136_04085 [Lentisphaerota bacterium ZTH]|nr:hypothetical protein JYG24_04800 [Lentisphaerota bacterium]WET07176.1 hypothetical protein P0136_04085 [Lentisphaerota bacterium ZTH]
MNDNQFFKIRSLKAGELQMEFRSNDLEKAIIKLPASHSDPLAEMADVLLKINANYDTAGNVIDSSARFFTFWEADKTMYTCEYTPRAQRVVDIEMNICNNMYAGIHTHDDFCLRFRDGIDNILANIYEEMKRLLMDHGFCGYRSSWSKGEFPLSYFLQLHNLVEHGAICLCPFKDEIKALGKIYTD